MDYELMYKKLEVARKEMRQNVPILKLIDDTLEKINRELELIFWNATANVKYQ